MVALDGAACRSVFYSHETKTRSFDDGKRLITSVEERNHDSGSPESVRHRLIVGPSKLDASESKGFEQMGTNPFKTISSGFFDHQFDSARDLITKARAVGIPALPVSSSVKTNNPEVTVEMAKLLNVKQGHYADLYDRLDFPNLPTKRPADAIEDAIRVSVLQTLN